ncbi:MAG: signal peptide protein [Planctomycetaceae bacterium]|nr:signal peptide protein [Planctomycetaceae bacterium]
MSAQPLSRRTVLKALGAAIPLPLLEAMLPRVSLAAGTSPVPPRMLVCHFGTGMNIREFFPAETGPDCVLPRIVNPLEAWRKRMTIVSGLKLEHGGGHTGDYTFLTGTEGWTSTGIKSGISADQLVANSIAQETRFPSLQLSIARGTNYGQQGLATLSWNKNGIPLAAENDPQAVFRRLFGVDDEHEAVVRRAGHRRRGSILDYVNDQAKRMERSVGANDRQKLDEYFTSVREIEGQLKRDVDWSQRPKPKPELGELGDYSRSLTPAVQGFDYNTYQKLMYDLIALSFQTDSTRVITYNVRQELAGGTFAVHRVSKDFHALTHHNNDPKNLDELAQVDQINMGFWAKFMARMDQIKQVDGSSLLDHTMLAFSSSAGMDHSRDKLPTAIFGGEALGLKHHTHLKLAENTPLARVWHTMADRMGVQTETIQDSKGPISELLRA